MYTVTVEAKFSAVHRVRMPDGTLEPPHGHDWLVRAYWSRSALDETAMVIDFGQAQSNLESVVGHLHHADLNNHEALNGLNPTAEVIAKYVFDRIRAPGPSAIRRVEVTEAPGCVAAFEPSPPRGNAESV